MFANVNGRSEVLGPPPAKPCTFWHPWANTLEHASERWFVRNVRSDLIWANHAGRKWLDLKHHVNHRSLTWDMVARQHLPELERAQHQAVATGGSGEVKLLITPPSSHQPEVVSDLFACVKCAQCRHACPLLVILMSHLVSDSPLAPRPLSVAVPR